VSEIPVIPGRPMSKEAFELLLLEIRNGASETLTGLATEQIVEGQTHDAKIEDVRAVWHAAEIALGILYFPIYVPKREALEDVRALLAELEEDTT
jgi:hypothetical protein